MCIHYIHNKIIILRNDGWPDVLWFSAEMYIYIFLGSNPIPFVGLKLAEGKIVHCLLTGDKKSFETTATSISGFDSLEWHSLGYLINQEIFCMSSTLSQVKHRSLCTCGWKFLKWAEEWSLSCFSVSFTKFWMSNKSRNISLGRNYLQLVCPFFFF